MKKTIGLLMLCSAVAIGLGVNQAVVIGQGEDGGTLPAARCIGTGSTALVAIQNCLSDCMSLIPPTAQVVSMSCEYDGNRGKATGAVEIQ